MNRFKKFLIVFLSFLPSSASAVAAWVIGLGAGVATIAGISIYRSITTLDTNGALDFFSSCWSCQMFSDVLATMSRLLPPVYNAIGTTIVPVAFALTAIWFAWTLLSNFTNSKFDVLWIRKVSNLIIDEKNDFADNLLEASCCNVLVVYGNLDFKFKNTRKYV